MPGAWIAPPGSSIGPPASTRAICSAVGCGSPSACSCDRARLMTAMASTADRRSAARKLVTCSSPVMSGVTSVASVPLVSAASRFCKLRSSLCARARRAAHTSTAAAPRRGSMPRRLQFTYRWESESKLQQAFWVAAQHLLAVLWSEWHMRHPLHAGRVGHEGIIDRKENAIGAHLHHAAKQRRRREIAARRDPEVLVKGVAKGALAVALPAERHVDAPERKRQRFAEMPHDDFQSRIGVEDAREHEAYALRRCLHG